MRLFWARGYDGLSTADLSAALGVKPPSVYAAFGSKAGIFAAALDRYDAVMGPAFAGLFTAPDPAAAVRTVLDSAAALYTAWPDMPGCLVLDGVRGTHDGDAQAAAARHRAAFRETLRARLVALGDPVADLRSDATLTAMMGLSAAARAGLPSEALRATARALAEGLGRLA
jgi:TetR/AcrR family transcriptional regulator, repressor for divergent bdcA